MKKLLLLILLAIPLAILAQPTYVGTTANPADNGTNTASPLSITPPGSMSTGDLVVLYVLNKESKANITSIELSNTGGQTWFNTGYVGGNGAPPTEKIFWCRYNGTWGANPAVAFVSSSTVVSLVMHVFRPVNSTDLWMIEEGPLVNDTNNSVNPYTTSVSSQTYTTSGNKVSIAAWHCNNNLTFSSLTGSGWSVAGSAQYRNLQGSDQSQTFAYKLTSGTGSSGSPSKNANTTIVGFGSMITFAEYNCP